MLNPFGPTLAAWSEFATSMRSALAVAEVNCDEHGALCKAEGITGYPTLVLWVVAGND